MTWSYSGDPSASDLDKVRFMVGDTDAADQLLSDEEITYLLTTKVSVLKAAQDACRSIIAKLARDVDYKIGPEQVSASERLANYRQLQLDLKSEVLESFAAPTMADPVVNSDEPLFDLGMNDNPGGGSVWINKLNGD